MLTIAQKLTSSIRLLQSDYGVLNYMTNAQLLLQLPPIADNPTFSPRPSPITHIPVKMVIMETGVTHSMTRVNGIT
jgi:hypothetical protein